MGIEPQRHRAHRGRTNGDDYPGSKYAIHFKQEGNLDLEFRLLAKNAICNRMNRLL